MLISILMPIKNGSEFMKYSISSIINQTYTEWELVIGINGLPPNSSALTQALNYQQYINNRFQQEGKTIVAEFDTTTKADTLNAMMALTNNSSEYIALLDVDDIWESKKLETQLPFLGGIYDVVGSSCVYFGEGTGHPQIPVGHFSSFPFYELNPIINSSCVIRKPLAVWDATHFVEDYDLWLRLWKAGHTFYNCPEHLVRHRIHKGSAFNGTNHLHVPALIKHHQST